MLDTIQDKFLATMVSKDFSAFLAVYEMLGGSCTHGIPPKTFSPYKGCMYGSGSELASCLATGNHSGCYCN